MDDKLAPRNALGSTERQPALTPEDLQAGSAAPIERAPVLGASPAQPPPIAQTPPPVKRLSPEEVAAAISATPGGPPPPPLAGVPSTAGDVDVIEPEWVTKAENVVAQHQGDPYGEEEAIEDLQQDYLKKRYGYDVANPNSDSSKPEGT
jgi:hypothetical protein